MTATTQDRYPVETFESTEIDDGTMPENVATLAEAVVGRKIVAVNKDEKGEPTWYGVGRYLTTLTLDDGTEVQLRDSDDCCAYTELKTFLLNPELIDHVILGVGTTEEYERWHIYADAGDVLQLEVGWSSGNPFYYGYGFTIDVVRP